METERSPSFEQIYRRHRDGLFALSLSILGCEQLAEDAIHDAFVSICRQSSRPTDSVAYVYAAVRNSSIDLHRRASSAHRVNQTLFNGYIPPARDAMAPENGKVLDRERDRLLREAIDRLPTGQREVLVLKCFSELTHEQISNTLEVPPKTVATRYRRALIKLREKLKGKL